MSDTRCTFLFQNDIFTMFRELFEAASSQPPPRGINPNPQSRAMYAIDLMLSWDKKDNGETCSDFCDNFSSVITVYTFFRCHLIFEVGVLSAKITWP